MGAFWLIPVLGIRLQASDSNMVVVGQRCLVREADVRGGGLIHVIFLQAILDFGILFFGERIPGNYSICT